MRLITCTFLIMLVFIIDCQAQSPIFKQENGMTIWKYRIFTWDLPPNGNSIQTERTYVLNGDTVIGGKMHHVLYIDRTDNDTVQLSDLVRIGYLYKDSGRIWKLDTSLSKRKIFDFTLSKGDTLQLLLSSCILANIGSYIRNSNTYPLFLVNPGLALSQYSYTEEFGHIEGQGILTDDFQYIPIGIHRIFELVTFNSYVMKNGFLPDVIDSAVNTLSVNDDFFGNDVQLYPNPSNGKVFIKTNLSINGKLRVTLQNIFSNTVKQFLLNSKDDIIDVSNVLPGFYTYTVFIGNKIVSKGKLEIY